MFTIDKYGRIVITKGDSASLKLDIVKADGEKYVPVVGETIVFTAKKNINQEQPSMQIVAQDCVVIFPPRWDMDAGLYIYDVQLNTVLGNVYTIAHGYMDVVGEVTIDE